ASWRRSAASCSSGSSFRGAELRRAIAARRTGGLSDSGPRGRIGISTFHPHKERPMRRRSLLKYVVPLLLVLAPSVALAQGIEADRQRLRTAQDDIRALRSQYAEAYNAKDAAAVAALYTSDGIMVNSSRSEERRVGKVGG